jgi:hypothetical protein
MIQWDDNTAPYPEGADLGDDGEDELYNPISYERDMYEPDGWEDDEPLPVSMPTLLWTPRGPAFAPGGPGGGNWPDQSWPPRLAAKPRRPRWLVPGTAVLAAVLAAGMTYVLVGTGTHGAAANSADGARSAATAQHAAATGRPAAGRPAAKASQPTAPTPQPPVSMAGAKAVLAGYATANNRSNAKMSDSLLGTYESGSSYALDAGFYRAERGAKSAPYPAFTPAQAQFYIPREAAAYPHWFAALATNVGLAKGSRDLGIEYLVFTQAAPGAPWKDADEPYVPKGGAAATIALDADGLATAVAPGASGLALTPATISTVTARSLDGAGPVTNPGNLADFEDQAFWRRTLPKDTAVSVRHSPTNGPVFGLRTTDGGALLFYTDAAETRLTAPRGQTMRLKIAGFYDGKRLTTANVGYLEQFATYDPPQGTTGPRVVADYSGITS